MATMVMMMLQQQQGRLLFSGTGIHDFCFNGLVVFAGFFVVFSSGMASGGVTMVAFAPVTAAAQA